MFSLAAVELVTSLEEHLQASTWHYTSGLPNMHCKRGLSFEVEHARLMGSSVSAPCRSYLLVSMPTTLFCFACQAISFLALIEYSEREPSQTLMVNSTWIQWGYIMGQTCIRINALRNRLDYTTIQDTTFPLPCNHKPMIPKWLSCKLQCFLHIKPIKPRNTPARSQFYPYWVQTMSCHAWKHLTMTQLT